MEATRVSKKVRRVSKKMKKDDQVDMISNLPEAILHSIFSFLDMDYVVRTSVLSKRWKSVWKSVPFLDFDRHFSYYTKPNCFEVTVDKVLSLRKTSCVDIQSGWDVCDSIAPHVVYKWIHAALSLNVQDLYLYYRFPFKEFQLPNCLFTYKSLRKLGLFLIKEPLILPDQMSLPQLNTLILHQVRLISNDMLKKILFSCPVLESLILHKCTFYKTNIEISSATQLKHLVIKDCSPDDFIWGFWEKYSIILNAPNLISFQSSVHIIYSINSLSALVKADIDIDLAVIGEIGDQRMMRHLQAFHNVEALTLSQLDKRVLRAPALLESQPIQFCKLRCLKLHTELSSDTINGITYLPEISPNIESLSLNINEGTISEEKIDLSLQCKLYHLKSVEIRGIKGFFYMMIFLEILLKNAMVLEKVVLYTFKGQGQLEEGRQTKLNEQLLSLPRASSSITISLL